jgi:hypothetical protein
VATTETAVFFYFQPLGGVLFVLGCRIVSLFALGAFQRYDHTHLALSPL